MLKTVSREEMYLLCASVKNKAVARCGSKAEKEYSQNILTICNEMEEYLDRMPQLEKALKLQSLVKELHNHVHNH